MTESRPLILVVDDGLKNIKLMRAILEPAGYDVLAATDGAMAIQLAQSAGPGLILLDLMMPGLDGFAVCSRLKAMESTRQIPVIVVTARDDAEAESRCFALGAADYIAKPISLPVVLARVKTHLELDAQRRSLEGMFRDVMEFAPDAIVLTDAQGTVVRVNRCAEQMFGYPREALVGSPVQYLVPNGLVAGTSLLCRRQDGSEFPADINLSPLQTLQGDLVMAVARDVSERDQANLAIAQSRGRLRALMAQNETSREAERKHLAREVHDELGQVLTALRMDLSLLDMRFGELNPALNSKVKDMKSLLDRAIRGVRHVVTDLRPTVLDIGLIPALESLCMEFSEHSGTACKFHCDEVAADLDESRRVVVFRIVQESLTNAMRYAEASEVNVSLGRTVNHLVVEVRDNGRGFDPLEVPKTPSFGLLGMRERALALGGQVRIVSAPGRGVVVGLTIPFNAIDTEESR